MPGVGSFTVKEEIGAGALGVVYNVRFEPDQTIDTEEQAALLDPDKELVIKFAHRLPLPTFKKALTQEMDDAALFKEKFIAAKIVPIPGAAVLFKSKGNPPFIIKEKIGGLSLKALSELPEESPGVKLSDSQIAGLKEIYEKALALADVGIYLDIKPTNLSWVPDDLDNKKGEGHWVMYELTQMPNEVKTHFVDMKFEDYLETTNKLMRPSLMTSVKNFFRAAFS